MLSLAASQAAALGLGRIASQSALGEPLRVEIEVSSISPDEAAGLQVRIAGPEAYVAAGVDYNPILASARAVLQRRPDGRTVLRLISDRVVQEPFVEVILDLAWPSGHLVRSYTLLMDPPASRTAAVDPLAAAAAGVSVAPALASAPVRSAAAPAPVTSTAPSSPGAAPVPRGAAPGRTAAQPLTSEPVEPAGAQPRGPRLAEARGADRPPAPGGERYLVRPGDTLAGIASRNRPSGVSLDQMLASLYRSNPGAFIGNDIDRLRSGVLLTVPGAEQARAFTPEQARQTIQARSADFDAYRRGLAGAATGGRAEDASRRAAGSVQAAVEDRRPAASSPDRLTLSKDANTVAAIGDALASLQRERRDAEVRLSALMRSIEELKALAGPAGVAEGGLPSAASTASAARASATAGALEVPGAQPSSSQAAVSAAAPSSGAGLGSTASALPASPAASPVAAVLPARARPAETPPAESDGFFATLTENSLLPLTLAGLVLAVALLVGARRMRRRQADSGSGTSFLDSRQRVDSLFAPLPSSSPDSRTPPLGSLSSGYSLSQLDAGGDVDPVAEADVYLAYGRDLQAEEILKDAMRSDPERLAIRTKLLEVYAKRRDSTGFEVLASQLHVLTGGEGEEWQQAQELGRGLDPHNPLYGSGGAPRRDLFEPQGADDPLGPNTLPQVALLSDGDAGREGGDSVDIEIDFGFDEAPAPAAAPASGELAPLDFSSDDASSLGLAPKPAANDAAASPVDATTGGSGLPDLNLLDLPAAAPLPPAPAAAPTADGAPDLLDLDLLDLGAPAPAAAAAPSPAAQGNARELLDLEIDLFDGPTGSAPAASPTSYAADETPELLDLDLLDPSSLAPPAPSGAVAPAPAPGGDFSLDFDLSGISLDLDSPASAPAAPAAEPAALDPHALDFFPPSGASDPLQHKLGLAEELLQLGDSEGARELLEEVIGQAQGAQKVRAEALRSRLA